MKTILIAAIFLLFGLIGGLWYGWSTGVVDGQTHTMLRILPVIQLYGAFRDTEDTEKRDQMMDAATIACIATFAGGKSYSPMFMFFHPKADAGLIDALVTWELDHPSNPALDIPSESSTSKRIDEVKKIMSVYWDKEVERQKKRRQEIKKKAEQGAAANPYGSRSPLASETTT